VVNRSIVIKSTGEVIRKDLEKLPTLDELQKVVGGYIELIPHFETYLGEKCIALCNEDGKLNNLPFNSTATVAWIKNSSSDFIIDDMLVGDVVIIIGDKKFLSEF